MYSFNGRFNYRLDDKNRIRIPPKFKPELEGGYKLAYGPGNSIYVMPMKEYQKIIESFGDVSFFDEDAQNQISLFTSMVHDVTEDNQGRVMLPAEMRAYAGIDKDIVITGAAAYIRIESAEAFAKRTQNLNISNIFAKLNALPKSKDKDKE